MGEMSNVERMKGFISKSKLLGVKLFDFYADEEKDEVYITHVYDDGKEFISPKWISGFRGLEKDFRTLEELGYYYGLRMCDLRNPDNNGYSLEEIIKYELTALYKGEVRYVTLQEICEEWDYDYDKIYERWNKTPDLSRADLLMEMLHECGGDVYRNIFGELIVPSRED